MADTAQPHHGRPLMRILSRLVTKLRTPNACWRERPPPQPQDRREVNFNINIPPDFDEQAWHERYNAETRRMAAQTKLPILYQRF